MLEKIDPDIAAMLMPGEEILLVASQSKTAPGGALTSPNKIYITNNRVLFKDPKWFGLKARIIDVGYGDIATVMLKRGLFTTEIYLKPRFSPHKIELPAVDKKVATHASLLIQKGMRGELGGKARSPPSPPSAPSAAYTATYLPPAAAAARAARTAAARGAGSRQEDEEAGDDDPLALKLQKLGDMRRKGIISEQEFDVLKEELMYSAKLDAEVLQAQKEPPAVPVPVPAAEAPAQTSIMCRSCSAPLPANFKFCPQCGTSLQAAAEDTAN